MKHPRTWYVVADGGRARILKNRTQLQKDLTNVPNASLAKHLTNLDNA